VSEAATKLRDAPTQWTQAEAVELCRRIEALCPEFGCHVALTGGTLYKDGPRKDLDLLFYRIRQRPKIDQDGLWIDLETVLGLKLQRGFGWCFKLEDRFGRKIDAFFPEEQGGEYDEEAADLARDLSFSDPDEEVAF
jgi:hypothetical protein